MTRTRPDSQASIAAEWSGATLTGAPTAAYAHAGIDEPLMRLTGNSGGTDAAVAYYLQDGIGSVRALASSDATGAVSSTATQSFDAWGRLLQAAGNIPTYGYAGREPDASGLVYNRARYYMPGYGRFASRDPIGLQGGINPYSYAGNDPVSFNDPSGLLAANAANAVSDYWGQIVSFNDPSGNARSTLESASAFIATGARGIGAAIGGGFAAGGTALLDGLISFPPTAVVLGAIFTPANAGQQVRDQIYGPYAAPIYNQGANNENTNPYQGPVDKPVVVVDNDGNAIPVGQGQQVRGSPNGDYQQVIGADGKPTGDRLDRGGHRGQADPRAQGPHGHRPGVTTLDGNPHLPINPRKP